VRKRGEKIVKGRTGWYKANEVRRIKIMMSVIAVTLCVSVAAGAVLFWVEVKQPFSKPVSATIAESSKSTSTNEELPVYDNSYNLRVVNSSNGLKSDFHVQLEEFNGVKVDSKIVPALKKMMEDAKAEGCALKLTKGYVSAEEQERLYNTAVQDLMKNQGYSQVRAQNEVQNTIGRGGFNENQTGMAVEFTAESLPENGDFTTTKEYKWLLKNSVQYGFILRYPENKASLTGMAFNPRHFRYVGTANAVKMREYSMCLEEYATYMNQQSPK
jgi:zinc D-Ala-D-Ala carboxypeptidase